MNKKRVREKSILLIYLIISLSFFVSFTEEVKAQRSQQACCEKTISGDYCVYTNRNQCDTSNGKGISNTNCEETTFCGNICCVDNNEGCFPNEPRASCKNKPGTIYEDSSCRSVEGCVSGCCIIGEDFSFISESECKNLAQSIYGTNYNLGEIFKKANSEQACIDLSLQEQEGCCVDDKTCSFTKKSACNDEFNLGRICSSLDQCQNCEPQKTKGCKDGNVYWFDSCGNPENLIETCDYAQGNFCVENGDEASCKSIDCEETTEFENWNYTGSYRKHGESWCVYEGPTGNFVDRPGTRHYKFSCLNGEEIMEECADYRQEICVQANYEKKNSVTQSTNFSYEDFSKASCIRNNIYESEITSNLSTVASGFKFWENNDAYAEQCSLGTTRCNVYYVKEHRFADYKCKANCFCETKEFLDQANTYCKSFGDCGFSYNIKGEPGSGGLNVYWSGRTLGNNPTTMSQGYLDFLKKYGIYGGMAFLNAETEKIINAAKPDTLKDYADEVLIYGAVGLIFSGFITQGILNIISGVPIDITTSNLFLSGIAGAGSGALSGVASSAFVQTLAVIPATSIVAAVIVIVTTAIEIVLGGGKVRVKTLNFECRPWQAPLGGENCDKCDDEFGCTDYKCKSLGTTCQFYQDNDRKVCVDGGDPNDINSPRISPLDIQDYSIREERLGYDIVEQVEPFKLFNFGIKTDENALCKYDLSLGKKYDEMTFDFGDSFFKKEHNLTLVLASDKEYKYYVRCTDTKGNKNEVDYLVSFKTKKGIDKGVPVITSTSIRNGAIVASNSNNLLVDFFLNEPATCRYDISDKSYDAMRNQTACTEEYDSVPLQHSCSAAFSGLRRGQNSYYFRCRDLSNNTNSQSYLFNLVKSDALNINVVDPSPRDLVYVNDVTLALKTSGGSDDGKSICRYSEEDESYDKMNEFKITDSTNHLQSQTSLRRGNYEYFVKCRDNAGNEDSEKIKFRIVLDRRGNEIISVYKDSSRLYVILNVESSCEYDSKEFTFGNGNKMDGDRSTVHTASLNLNEFNIKCEDSLGNEIKGIKVNV